MPKKNTIPFSRLDQSSNQDLDAEILEDAYESGNLTMTEAAGESVKGEQEIGGDTPDPTIDDDALEMAHTMGLGLDADYENPKELNIAEDVAKAERHAE